MDNHQNQLAGPQPAMPVSIPLPMRIQITQVANGFVVDEVNHRCGHFGRSYAFESMTSLIKWLPKYFSKDPVKQ